MSPDPVQTKESLILAAATKRFAHFGFSKVTMDEIAADVGMAKPSLYYYYATKERLFTAVFEHDLGEFVRDIEALLKRKSPASQKLKEYAAARIRLFQELATISHVGSESWMDTKAMSQEFFRNLEHQELKFLQSIVALGRADGEFSPSNPHTIAQLLLRVLQGLRLRTLRAASGPRLDDASYSELKRDADLFIEHILNGIRTHH